ACLLDQLKQGTFRNHGQADEKGYRNWGDEAGDAMNFCAISNTEGKACTLATYRRTGLSIELSRYVCRYRSQSLRSCMIDLAKGNGPFAGTDLDRERNTLADAAEQNLEPATGFWSFLATDAHQRTNAERICSYSDATDRACVLRSYRFFLTSAPSERERAISLAQDACEGQSQDYQSCIQDVASLKHFATGGIPDTDGLLDPIKARDICHVHDAPTRACIIENLLMVLRPHGMEMGELVAACQAGLVAGLNAPGGRSPVFPADVDCATR
ncbi:MAG TPA: hypothetical protein VL588_10410, partial [Bdellovibrionota bacterium]|nr:hypothetical protein [Bdellovibrionota bacterium]